MFELSMLVLLVAAALGLSYWLYYKPRPNDPDKFEFYVEKWGDVVDLRAPYLIATAADAVAMAMVRVQFRQELEESLIDVSKVIAFITVWDDDADDIEELLAVMGDFDHTRTAHLELTSPVVRII